MSDTPKVGALRVWHIPQIPGEPFLVTVKNIEQALVVIGVLAKYDAFQLGNKIKPDYCNASGLDRYESDAGEGKPGWGEWSSQANREPS